MPIFRSTSGSITISFHLGVQSHWTHSFRPCDSFLFFSFGIQSRFSYPFMHFKSPSFFSLAFRVVVHIRSGTLSCHLCMFSTFKVISPQLYHSESVSSIHIHWHCTSCLHGFAFILTYLTSLPYAYRLFIITHPDSSFHCTWHSPSSSRHIFLSCCWSPYTWHAYVVQIG